LKEGDLYGTIRTGLFHRVGIISWMFKRSGLAYKHQNQIIWKHGENRIALLSVQ